MEAQKITEILGERQIWSKKLSKWIDHEALSKFPHIFVYGDDGGDLFARTPDTVEELTKLVESHANGITDCCFDTSIRLIVRNGKRVEPRVTLVDVE